MIITLVEVVGAYSKSPDLGKQIERVLEWAEKAPKRPENCDPPHRLHKLERRLAPETIAEIVEAYKTGESTPSLRQRFELSSTAILRLLTDHDVKMRGQGLSDVDVPAIIELYKQGLTLAQLAAQYETSPGTIRRALVASGATLRQRGGSKPRRARRLGVTGSNTLTRSRDRATKEWMKF